MKSRLTLISFALYAAALALAGAAAAENYQYRVAARDQATAARAVLQRADVGGLAGWTGGVTKPDHTPEKEADRCNGYLPKQSDLVVTGDAETKYDLPGSARIDTQVTIMRSSAMVQTDWQRTVGRRDFLACQRQSAAHYLAKNEHLISITKLPYSTYGTKSVAFRALLSVTNNGKTLRVALDVIGFYRGRAEASVAISGGAPTANDLMVLRTLDLRVADIVNAKLTAS